MGLLEAGVCFTGREGGITEQETTIPPLPASLPPFAAYLLPCWIVATNDSDDDGVCPFSRL